MNELYNAYMSNPYNRPSVNFQSMNPMQKMSYMMQAMQNPAAFVQASAPDVPAYMLNNPDQIRQYLQQTRNISNEQIQSMLNQFPYRR